MTDTTVLRPTGASGPAAAGSDRPTEPTVVVSHPTTASFDPVLDRLIVPEAERLAVQLRETAGLGADERTVILAAATRAWRESVRPKVTRALVLDVHAARISGRLVGPDPSSRWKHWLKLATTDDFWPSMDARFPTLRRRVATVLGNSRRAAASFAK